MPKAKAVIGIGMVVIVAVSIWAGLTSGPIRGIAYFFILTVMLWAWAKVRHWI
ncbi:MAG: hypothetical protein JW775_12345 [Candidatus Aminicenantes bacterium]|nr:hypothetical protein [Candidatus Aminicenantes bacterium]